MRIADRSLFYLQQAGISVTETEFLAIKLHDGLYEEGNKPYYITFSEDVAIKSNLPYIIHQADLMAARIEFEHEWFPKFKGNVPPAEKNYTLNNNQPNKKISVKTKALSSIKSPGLQNVMSDFFK